MCATKRIFVYIEHSKLILSEINLQFSRRYNILADKTVSFCVVVGTLEGFSKNAKVLYKYATSIC